MAEESDYLDEKLAELHAQYEETFAPKLKAAERRGQTIRQVTLEIAIQASGTVIGGAVLAGGAVALGWLSSEPTWQHFATGFVFVMMLLIILGLRAASKPFDTAGDHDLLQEIRWVQAAIADRNPRGQQDPGDADA